MSTRSSSGDLPVQDEAGEGSLWFSGRLAVKGNGWTLCMQVICQTLIPKIISATSSSCLTMQH